jgi:hypothetical protein
MNQATTNRRRPAALATLAVLMATAPDPAGAQERADLATAALAAPGVATVHPRTPWAPPTPADRVDGRLGPRLVGGALGSGLGAVLGLGAGEAICGSGEGECLILLALPAAALASSAGSVFGVHVAGAAWGEDINAGDAWAGAGLGVLLGALTGAAITSTTRSFDLGVVAYALTQGALTAMASLQA